MDANTNAIEDGTKHMRRGRRKVAAEIYFRAKSSPSNEVAGCSEFLSYLGNFLLTH